MQLTVCRLTYLSDRVGNFRKGEATSATVSRLNHSRAGLASAIPRPPLSSDKMLAKPRWRATSIYRISRRLQSTLSQAEAGTSTPSPTPPEPSVATKLRRQRRRARGTIFIRPWDGVSSMPEALAIVRAVEKKYGKVQDFMVMRVSLHLLHSVCSGSRMSMPLTCIGLR